MSFKHALRVPCWVCFPTTPNPTTGWYAVVPEDAVINLSMPIEEAFKVVISGGIVAPDASVSLPASSKRTLDLFPDQTRQAIALEDDVWES